MPNPKSKNEWAALSYLSFFSVLILWASRDDDFAQHHARQGVVLFVLSLLLWPVDILRYGELLILILMVMGFIKAMMKKRFNIPIIREIADGTLQFKHVKGYWSKASRKAIKVASEKQVAPALKEEIQEQEQKGRKQQRQIKEETRMREQDEKKLSSMNRRLREDEKKIRKLEEELRKLRK